MSEYPTLPALLESFFRNRLARQRNASRSTMASYLASAEPALIVFGFNKALGCPQAAWFSASLVKRVYAAAQRIGLSNAAVDSEERRGLAAKLSEGQLLSGGKLLLPAIEDQLYQQLQGLLVKQPAAAEARAPANGEPDAAAKPGDLPNVQEPTELAPPTEAAVPVTAAAWNAITPGTRVLALYLDKRGNPDGWWEADVVHIRRGVFFVTWSDDPDAGVVMRQRDQIALILPTT
jgi:hypothetical protein